MTAFKEMETEARFIKKHYLLMPPLTLADFSTLLLPLPDETHTPVPLPSGQSALTITYPGGPHPADGSPCASSRPSAAAGTKTATTAPDAFIQIEWRSLSAGFGRTTGLGKDHRSGQQQNHRCNNGDFPFSFHLHTPVRNIFSRSTSESANGV
jgi:hypothetical protein